MLKRELTKIIADEFNYFSYEDIESAIQIIFESMISTLKRNNRIEVRGFGSFTTRRRKPKKARNPKTGASVLVSEKMVPFFVSGKELRERMNK